MTADALPSRALELYEALLRYPKDVGSVVELARTLANSGTHRSVERGAADVASTGGPSSLSTLLCPLNLVSFGYRVPKIGVPGRPAGGIDVLGTIPGYQTRLSPGAFERTLSIARYAHTTAGETWAPADAVLFQLRQDRGTQAIPALAVASLLAKKLAAGVNLAALDARVAPHGNFGASLADARQAAQLYCEASLELGLTPVVVLTDARSPYQPFIGRGEALTALMNIVSGGPIGPWLKEHVTMCSTISATVVHQGADQATPEIQGTSNAPLIVMKSHLAAQGSSWHQLEERVDDVASQNRSLVCAERSGFIHYNLARIRESLASTNLAIARSLGANETSSPYPDHAGIQLLIPPWTEVAGGTPVIAYRTSGFGSSAGALQGLFEIKPTPASRPNQILEVFRP